MSWVLLGELSLRQLVLEVGSLESRLSAWNLGLAPCLPNSHIGSSDGGNNSWPLASHRHRDAKPRRTRVRSRWEARLCISGCGVTGNPAPVSDSGGLRVGRQQVAETLLPKLHLRWKETKEMPPEILPPMPGPHLRLSCCQCGLGLGSGAGWDWTRPQS